MSKINNLIIKMQEMEKKIQEKETKDIEKQKIKQEKEAEKLKIKQEKEAEKLKLKQEKEAKDKMKEEMRALKENTKLMKELEKKEAEIKKEKEKQKIKESSIIIENDKHGCDIIIDKLKKTNKLIKSNGRWFYKKYDNANIYTEITKDDDLKNFLFAFINNLNIKKEFNDKIIDYSKNTNGCCYLIKSVISNYEDDEEFIKKLWYSNLYKLCFLDGYYNYKDSKFYKYDNETYTIAYVKYNYDDFKNIEEKHTKFICDKILDPILYDKEQQKYILNWFARGLAGHYEEKTYTIGLGCRNSGKGVLTELFINSLKNYIETFSGENLIIGSKTDDIEKSFKWTIPFEHKRIYLSNEIKTENEDKNKKYVLDGDIIKKISSGGDTLKARALFKDIIEYKIQGRMCLFMNEMLEIAPSDAKKTLTPFIFQSIFVPNITEQQEKMNNLKNTQRKYFLMDDSIKNEINNNKYIHLAFIKILIEAYTNKPLPKPEIINNNEDYLDNSKNDENEIKKVFIFTDNEKDKIKRSELFEIAKDNGLKLTKAKIKMLLLNNGCYEKTINGNIYIYGIKEVNEIKE